VKIERSPSKFLMKFLFVTEHWLRQQKFVRWLCGGLWAKLQVEDSPASWEQVEIACIAEDGTKYLNWYPMSGGLATFHESHRTVKALESYK
jgi:hypothetical protein